MRHGLVFTVLPLALVAAFAACGGSGGGSGFGPSTDGGAGGGGGGGGGRGDSGSATDAPILSPYDASKPPEDSGGGAPVAVVYAHSATVLYKLDPVSKAVTVVGPFIGCTSVIDFALDQSSNDYVTTSDGFYKVDLTSAVCTFVASGSYPNSLSFVPKGTLDPNVEALVGYFGSEYVRIDPATGAITMVGALSQGYQSSGDIVSVIGGGTFLTVNGDGCSDCLFQVDPKTGDMIQNYRDVMHSAVYGIAFWAGNVYGFDNAGQIFEITWQNNAISTTNIPVPNPPAGLEFWGAGSTTSAPAVSNDGGGIPIR
jgi:hypothetical protein